MFTKEQMDMMCEEAFAEDDIEKNVDLGFDPMDVVTGDPKAMARFKEFRAKAKTNR